MLPDDWRERELSPAEQDMIERYAAEYVVDHNMLHAAVRIGVSDEYAIQFVSRYHRTGHCLRAIARHEKRKIEVDERESVKHQLKSRLIGIAVSDDAKPADQINAIKLLHQLFADEIEVDHDADVSSVMLVPMMAGDVDAWSAMAEQHQAKVLSDDD